MALDPAPPAFGRKVTPPDSVGTGIELRDVHKAFGKVLVLRGVSLTCAPGETTCIIGPSGSGKSTVLRCITGLEVPTSGQVLIGEVDLTASGVAIDAIRARIGMVFQQFNLFPHMTVKQNLVRPLRIVRKLNSADACRIALDALREVGMERFAEYRPLKLSGGQQQRVAIARALAMEPEAILFDEVTSALDPELVKGILNIMKGLAAQGMTMVVVTHEMNFAREVADKLVFMDRGQIVEQGPPRQLFEAPRSERLRAFFAEML